jgi:hypothetical protein
MIFHWVCNTTGASRGAETVYFGDKMLIEKDIIVLI